MPFIKMEKLKKPPKKILTFLARKKRGGRVTQLDRLLARYPRWFITYGLLLDTMDRKASPLSEELRLLIQTRVSQLNGCSFCIDVHAAKWFEHINKEQKIKALNKFAESSEFSDKEKAALSFVENVIHTDQQTDEKIFEQLRRHFSEDEIVELMLVIATIDAASKVGSGLGIESEKLCSIDIEA